MSEERVVIVTGSRNWTDRDSLWAALDAAKPTLLVHGGARGADYEAWEWAITRKVRHEVHCADWDRWGKSAGMRRNREMAIRYPQALVIACPLPGGKGTQAMMALCLRFGMRVQVVSPEGQ
jgi:hypothetical protein